MSITDEYIYWLDLETTGLDPVKDVILELAIVRARFEEPTKPLANYHVVFGLQGSDPETWHPMVREMHTKSGLLDECLRSTKTLYDAESVLDTFVPKPESDPADPQRHDGKWTLAGACVHFDRDFLVRHIPRIGQRFMNRTLDVSGLKLFCRTLGMDRLPKAEAHRALDDIAESMAHLVVCRKWLAQPETPYVGWGRVGDRA